MTPSEAATRLEPDTLPATGTAGEARRAALARLPPEPMPQSWVEYASRGALLIIGPADAAWPAATRLREELDCWVLATARPTEPPEAPPPAPTAWGTPMDCTGHLGAFALGISNESGALLTVGEAFGRERNDFDLILDLQATPAIGHEIPPPGYYRGRGADASERALAELPQMVGTFQKPKYFNYDPYICAHGARGLAGCRNCLDACATGAAISIGEKIEVDPYLCQGCGSCATSCPTGAIGYALPTAAELVDTLRRLIADYRAAAPEAPAPWLVFHGPEDGLAVLQAQAAGLPEHCLPVPIEDVGAVGPDAWLSALAFGAAGATMLTGAQPAARLAATTREQIDIATAVLEGLGDAHATRRLQLATDALAAPDELPPLVAQPATFGGLGSKREIMQRALAHLWEQAGQPAAAELPKGAPFGAIDVDREACTLCMACVSVCPASAVTGGGEEPKLLFREDRCVQCGLCATACPEDAIALQPRIDFAAHAEPAARVLNEEELLHCLDCGQAFATRKIVERMAEKLAGHWMFQDPAARERLYTCEECRVKRVLNDENAMAQQRER
ncbi:4Fe-4S binding protein [Algiphilus aromaticivorans]|uniref:4Fe-4S binding protein n=1 Tax=Algiphilus aromaticivorans TaxID=382454 RepID=UPI000694F856|nr:4Fe-4S binding protein [Algiphilus aromaticivorans]